MRLSEAEMSLVNGGALGGAVAGVVFGGCAGAVVWVAAGCQGGASGLMKCCTAGALYAGGIGAWLPI